jgi:uncharacterized protein YdaU (DUF1376 family)
MTGRPWMPLYIADYLADTVSLSTTEHGAYLLLIMEYWRAGGLPADGARLARITRLSPKEWHAIRDTIASFFGPNWTHKRIDAEMAKSSDITSKRSAAGRAGAHAMHGKRMANAQQSQRQTHGKPGGNRVLSHSSHSTVPVHEEESLSDNELGGLDSDSGFDTQTPPDFDPETGELE